MAGSQFLHGVETIEVASANQTVTINKMAVAGIVGTAPLADASAFPLDTPVLLTTAPQKASLLGETGTLLPAVRDFYAEGGGAAVVVRVADSATPTTQLTNVIGSLAAKTGVYALLTARSRVGVQPRTLIAPGFTATRPEGASNPVVAALLTVAGKLRGRVYASTPSTSSDEAIAWRQDWSSPRLTPIYPNVLAWDPVSSSYVTRPAEAAFAGLTARVHRENGFWYSPSNFVLQSIGGVSTPVDWASGDADCLANILNENRIATVINMGQAGAGQYGGWRRWGNRTTADDANWVFEVVRTIEDAVYEALDEATLWAVDKPPSVQLLLDMTERANAFFKYGKSEGFLVGGRCWLDPEDNPSAQLKAGVYTWRIDPEAPAPMEHIVYKAQRNASYYDDLLTSLSSMIAQQTAA
ncbi:phage tail sheath subtilisin-like domain-containing protein [Methylosinus sp. KRF6]|uniref:phage tail sheath subtilisin-like domain-containing protein n=1 Tax=Methylosinus sp. KRF6 TaxID=2846853 RepID=UPI001C0C086D|nr:phage tail sheath subtilisin-like domain-containing protein [Methylosinus sp. KRF6]MBU3890098.1 phage tail sheath subtilisin-like domain-containing protein [Methylosinus sp. KRF6]